MKKNRNTLGIKIASIIVALLLTLSCSNITYAESDLIIISAEDAVQKIEAGYTVIDAQKASSYNKEHIKGAVNIERSSINVSTPVPNSVAPESIIKIVAGEAGLKNDTDIIIYDDNKNMDASRLLWTLKSYGHSGDLLIVASGLSGLKAEGLEVSNSNVAVDTTVYETKAFNKNSIIGMDVISSMIDNPDDTFKLIDVRGDDEYEAGTIPGAIHINHENNLTDDFSFRTVKQIRSLYKKNGIVPEDNIAMFCKSSIRAANTYVALYNAGYRNIRVYDGAWLQWSKEKMPVFVPEKTVAVTMSQEDNS
ncbi:MAG: hypothetical protein B6229_07080 [Spirochaetaceae bacterium 4572_7]|nr:MAG: hypothetical protein B6229_07080 [Spirochaetaceae bacterium 4572_7]